MARKSQPRERKKAKSAKSAPFPRRTVKWLSLILAGLFLGVGNWFAHLPTEKRAAFGAYEPLFEKLGRITADFTDSLGLTGKDAEIIYTTALPTQNKFYFGKPEVADLTKSVKDIHLLKRQGYWVGWSPMCGHQVYAVYTIPAQQLLDKPPERPPFSIDPEAKDCPTPEDYTRTGYDRGHMAPNYLIATRYGKQAQKETFLMSNIVPQKPELNRGPWRMLEKIVADELTRTGENLWVITGPVPSEKKAYIKRGKARIPKGFFKIIASVKDGKLRVIGMYMPQEIREDKHPRYCFTSIDTIEAMTGLNFFSALSETEQAQLESIEPSRFWPSLEIF